MRSWDRESALISKTGNDRRLRAAIVVQIHIRKTCESSILSSLFIPQMVSQLVREARWQFREPGKRRRQHTRTLVVYGYAPFEGVINEERQFDFIDSGGKSH